MLHHFRRNRTYSHHERWGVFAAMFALTILVSAGGWLLAGQPVVSASSMVVDSVNLSEKVVAADGASTTTAVITLQNKETQEPAADVWVGLIVPDINLRTPELSYLDWYSFEPGRAFYQTDQEGKISFKLASTIKGNIEYQIFTANPELKNDNKYQKLETSFWVTYQ